MFTIRSRPASSLPTPLYPTYPSLDSATLVMCQLLGVEKNRAATVFWGTALAVVAALLLVAGGLQALQAASIVVGLPLAFVVAVLALGLVRDLLTDRV